MDVTQFYLQQLGYLRISRPLYNRCLLDYCNMDGNKVRLSYYKNGLKNYSIRFAYSLQIGEIFMISTRDLSLLPAIKQLKLLAQSLAMLDAIIEPEWEFRYYSFNAHWGREEAMASMRNGSGDDYFFQSCGRYLERLRSRVGDESLSAPAAPCMAWRFRGCAQSLLRVLSGTSLHH